MPLAVVDCFQAGDIAVDHPERAGPGLAGDHFLHGIAVQHAGERVVKAHMAQAADLIPPFHEDDNKMTDDLEHGGDMPDPLPGRVVHPAEPHQLSAVKQRADDRCFRILGFEPVIFQGIDVL